MCQATVIPLASKIQDATAFVGHRIRSLSRTAHLPSYSAHSESSVNSISHIHVQLPHNLLAAHLHRCVHYVGTQRVRPGTRRMVRSLQSRQSRGIHRRMLTKDSHTAPMLDAHRRSERRMQQRSHKLQYATRLGHDTCIQRSRKMSYRRKIRHWSAIRRKSCAVLQAQPYGMDWLRWTRIIMSRLVHAHDDLFADMLQASRMIDSRRRRHISTDVINWVH